MRGLATLLAGLGGAGQGYVKQRQFERNLELEQQRNAAYQTMMEGQAARDKAYSDNLVKQAETKAKANAAAQAWAKRNGIDVPPDMDADDVSRFVLEKLRQDGLGTRQNDAQAARLDEMQRRFEAMERLQGLRDAAIMSRVQYQTDHRQPPRDPDADFETQRRMRTTFLDDMLSAYGDVRGAYRSINADPELLEEARRLGLRHSDWLAAQSRRAGASRGGTSAIIAPPAPTGIPRN